MNRYRNDLGFECAALDSFASFDLRTDTECVLVFTSDAETFSNVFSRDAHMIVVECVPEAIFDHRIDEDTIAHAIAITSFRNAKGAMDMFSMPPATMTSASPALII